MLPTPRNFPFSDPDWIFEPKWDGYRALCLVEDGSVRFMSRNKRELTKRFPELSTLHQGIKAGSAILDGEIVALNRESGIQTMWWEMANSYSARLSNWAWRELSEEG